MKDRFGRQRNLARTFARTMLELFWSSNLSESVARGIARFEGLELDSCHKDRRQAVVYLCMHYSNFEWLSQFSAYSIGNGPVISGSKIRSLAAFSTVCAPVRDTV